ncbi:hypothetical protein [Geobacillus thermoleovorans]|uniref:hypothetical protein n=1 Tax=Geobacillus thermoleovorans TaxID=33941 RepID=UPI003D212729
MNVFWVGGLFWLSIGAALVFLIRGVMRQQFLPFLLCALLLLPSAYYFSGAENAYRWIMLSPLVPLLAAGWLSMKKR